MGNVQLNPDQSNTKRGGIVALASEDLTGMRSRLGVGGNSSGKLTIGLPAAHAALALFLIDDEVKSGEEVGISPITADENFRVVAKNTGNAGAVLVLADAATPADKGKVRTVPATAGLYFSPGIAEEGFVDGQHVLIRPLPRLIHVASADTITGAADLAATKAALLVILKAHGIVVA